MIAYGRIALLTAGLALALACVDQGGKVEKRKAPSTHRHQAPAQGVPQGAKDCEDKPAAKPGHEDHEHSLVDEDHDHDDGGHDHDEDEKPASPTTPPAPTTPSTPGGTQKPDCKKPTAAKPLTGPAAED